MIWKQQEDQLARTHLPLEVRKPLSWSTVGGCGCAFRCESSSTPTTTPSDSPPLASHWSGQQVEQRRDTGKRQGSGKRLMQDMKGGGAGLREPGNRDTREHHHPLNLFPNAEVLQSKVLTLGHGFHCPVVQ